MPGARFCDCGYDCVAQQIDRERAPRHHLSGFAIYQRIRLGIGGFACGLGGIALLVWEGSDGSPSFWGIVRALLLMFIGFGFVGFLVWRSNRHG